MNRELRDRANAIKQRHSLTAALAVLGLSDVLTAEQDVLAGQARSDIQSRLWRYSSGGLRKGETMPNGFCLTVVYGEKALLERMGTWVATINPVASYVVGFDHVPSVSFKADDAPCAFMTMSGSRLLELVELLCRKGPSTPWPQETFWAERSLSSGVVFSEHAGTPLDPPGADDQRIFEVSAWCNRTK